MKSKTKRIKQTVVFHSCKSRNFTVLHFPSKQTDDKKKKNHVINKGTLEQTSVLCHQHNLVANR